MTLGSDSFEKITSQEEDVIELCTIWLILHLRQTHRHRSDFGTSAVGLLDWYSISLRLPGQQPAPPGRIQGHSLGVAPVVAVSGHNLGSSIEKK